MLAAVNILAAALERKVSARDLDALDLVTGVARARRVRLSKSSRNDDAAVGMLPDDATCVIGDVIAVVVHP